MSEKISPQNGQKLSAPSTAWGWVLKSDGLAQIINGVHLGEVVANDSTKRVYKVHNDNSETEVAGAGIKFGFDQTSSGFTGIYAKPLPGHKVEALVIDTSTQKATWQQGTAVINKEAAVRLPNEDKKSSLGLPSGLHSVDEARSRMLRVTDTLERSRYFILDADFEGQRDNWNVLGLVVEVSLIDAEPVLRSDAKPELTP